ncbi:MAG: hypothetical protein ACK452_01265, partial [Bacteroidota bacterium]
MKFRFGKYDLKISYPVLLLVASILSFWQFATFSNVLRCDIQDAMYPWRYFAGECFQNGIFPFWNPYHQFGYPFYADLQYTNWNPEVWLIGNTFGYSYAFIYFLVFFYTWMAGLGMYKLITYLTNNNSLSFFIALSWMLSGCVIAHMQQFVTVIGIAWIPFVVWQFFALVDGLKWRNVFGFSIFSYLFLTGGYQALYFMLFYFFIAYAIYKLIQYRKFNNRLFLKLIFRSCLTIIILLVLLAPVFIAVYRSSNYVSRLDSGVNLSDANFSPLTPQSLISFFLPVISAKMEKFINTDITMSNLFIGLLPMIFLFYSFFKKNNALQILLLVFSLIYLLAAMGDYTPVREFLYNNVPLMNLFRLSGLFRIIVVFFLLIHISIFLNNENFSFRKLKISLIFFSSFYLIIVLFFATKLRSINSENGIMNKSIFDWINNASANVLIFWQSILFLTLLLSLLAWCYYIKKTPGFNYLSIFAFLFLFFGIQFNIYLNVAGSQSPKYLLEKSKKFPEVFPAPPFIPLNSSVSLTERINHVLNNEGNFYKKPMKESFSSFQLNGYVRLMDSLQNIKNYLYNQPFIFLSDSIISIQKSKIHTDISSKLFFSETEPNFSGDSKYRLNKEDKITLVNFEPNRFEVSVKNKYDVILNIQQSFFPGWKVYLNNIPINPILNSGFLMSISLNSGVNNIKFEFSDNV